MCRDPRFPLGCLGRLPQAPGARILHLNTRPGHATFTRERMGISGWIYDWPLDKNS